MSRFGPPDAVAADRWREAELLDGLELGGIPAAALVSRGQGFKDGAEDVRAFRRSCLTGGVTPSISLLLRSAMKEATTVIRSGRQRETRQGHTGRAAADGERRCGGGGNSRRGRRVAWRAGRGYRAGELRGCLGAWDGINRRRWAPIRRAVLDRDGWRCRKCFKAGRLEIDHVRPLAAGGDVWDLANLEALCRNCHFRKSANEVRKVPIECPPDDEWEALISEL